VRVHDLKCWPGPFRATQAGEKTHEVRVNDRGYQVGDRLRLTELDPTDYVTLTGHQVLVDVTYVTPGGTVGLPANVVVMSTRLVPGKRARGEAEPLHLASLGPEPATVEFRAVTNVKLCKGDKVKLLRCGSNARERVTRVAYAGDFVFVPTVRLLGIIPVPVGGVWLLGDEGKTWVRA
jgi:hypothetical protein